MLSRFTQCLLDMHKYWGPICADLIISSTFEFIIGNILETRADVVNMKLRGPSILWPNYFRDMTALSAPFSHFIYLEEEFPDISTFLQAIPEINNCVAFMNDILS